MSIKVPAQAVYDRICSEFKVVFAERYRGQKELKANIFNCDKAYFIKRLESRSIPTPGISLSLGDMGYQLELITTPESQEIIDNIFVEGI